VHDARPLKAVSPALGVRGDGRKEVLGLWIEQAKGAKFWLRVMSELKNRGVEDVLIAMIDGLKAFSRGDHRRVPAGPGPDLHRRPDPQLARFRVLQGSGKMPAASVRRLISRFRPGRRPEDRRGALTSSSTERAGGQRRAVHPWMQASWMTAVSAFPAIGLRPIPRRDVGGAGRRRGSRKPGK
jgi:hypothetical protein